MKNINRIHDKLIKKTFKNLENTRSFLEIALPEPLRKAMDLSRLTVDNTNYVSDTFKESFADIVVKTKMKTGSGEKEHKEIDADIYILVEHKSSRETAIFIQLLRYMYLMWQLDIDENKPLRVIIPIVFYHGKEKWNIPDTFAGQFNVSPEIKEFLLDYRYVLFDTVDWDFNDRRNESLKDNVFLLTALALMKSAFNEEVDTIREIFKFWREKGFTGDLDKVLLFMAYIYETKNLSRDKLKKMLEESKIDGGDSIMQTLAQKIRKEGEKIGEKIGEERGVKIGERKGKLETARELVKRGVDMGIIAEATGLPRDEIEKLASTVH